MPQCKITVLKRTFNQDFVDTYKSEDAAQQIGPCSIFQDGQEFDLEQPWDIPEGFCNWAWADIRQYVYAACLGGEFPRAKDNTFVTCCTDGFRPVFFKVEGIKESEA